MLLAFENIVLPLFLVILAGYITGRKTPVFADSITALTVYLLTPVLIWVSLLDSPFSAADVRQIGFFIATHTALLAGLVWLACRWLGLSTAERRVVLLVTLILNSGNMGIPLNQLAYGEAGRVASVKVSMAHTLLTVTIGIYLASGRPEWHRNLAAVFRMPLVYAFAAATLFSAFRWSLPGPMDKAVRLMADAAIPVQLICLGVIFAQTFGPEMVAESSHRSRMLWLSLIARVIVSPLLGLAIARIANMEGQMTKTLIVTAGMPTAVYAGILAGQYNNHPTLVSRIILATTGLSFLTLTALTYWLR